MGKIIDQTRKFRSARHGAGAATDALARLGYDHKAQRSLADLLEALADSLPDEVHRGSAELAAGLLREMTGRSDTWPAQAVFARIERGLPADSPVRRGIALARREKTECDGRAIELAEELDALAETGRARNPDALGFMLRAFFDGLRRHIDWIEVAILPHAQGATPRPPSLTAGNGVAAPLVLLGDPV